MSISIENLLETRAGKKGRLFIKGTRISVHNTAIWWKMGYNAEEISYRWELPLDGVHAALAYYFANRFEIDAEIAADEAEAERIEEKYKRLKYKEQVKSEQKEAA